MFSKPQHEHQWLAPLIGTFSFESECVDGEGQKNVTTGTVEGASIGGMWVILTGKGSFGDASWENRIILGYDLGQQRYVGTFIGSMFDGMWLYNGAIDPADGRLVLGTVGPKFDGGGTANYQDIVQIVDNDHWILSSRVQGDDGKWTDFMTAHHRRQQ